MYFQLKRYLVNSSGVDDNDDNSDEEHDDGDDNDDDADDLLQEFTELASSRKTSMALSTFSSGSQVAFHHCHFHHQDHHYNRDQNNTMIFIKMVVTMINPQYSEPPDALIKQDWERDPWEFPRLISQSSSSSSFHRNNLTKQI